MIVVGQDDINNTPQAEYAEGTFSYHDAAWVREGAEGGEGRRGKKRGKYECRTRERGVLPLSGSS